MSDAHAGAAADVSAHNAPVAVPRSVQSALLRYRVIAYVVGVGLIILIFVGVPLQVWGDSEAIVKIVGPLHGALYVIYVLLTLDLARRIRMNVVTMLLVMLAGTIPFLSFVAERRVTAMVMGPQHRA
jgi:integral membrane protein